MNHPDHFWLGVLAGAVGVTVLRFGFWWLLLKDFEG